MASLRVDLCYFLAYATFLSLIISCHSLPKNHVPLIIFGDSIFDPGNNNYINTTTAYQANFWPYGETFFKRPTGRFSNGRLISDFIAEYAGLPLIPSYLQPGGHKFVNGVNFASGRSGVLVETNQGYVVDLRTQVDYFKKAVKSLRQELGIAEAKKFLSKAVYLISIGGSDYLVRNSIESDEEFVGMVIGNLTIALKEIYQIGGRKFGFRNMAPLGCIPIVKIRLGNSGSCVNEVNKLCQMHNQQLPKVLHMLEEQLPGFKYANYNFYKAFSDRLHSPSKYGFKGATKACCGAGLYGGIHSCGGKRAGIKEFELCDNPNEQFFFDSYHPSEKVYQQFAEEMWGGGLDVIQPYNIKALFEA